MKDISLEFVNLLRINFKKMEYINKALELKSQLDTLRPISKEQEGRIMQKFRLDWNYHSNHLEGNTLTYGETKALILFGITAQGKPLKDTLEITGHNEAIDWVIDMVKGERPLTENFIRELHKMLLREPYEKKAINNDGLPVSRTIQVGSYKTVPNHVLTATGETFYFATPEETHAKMHDLLVWYNTKKEDKTTNPILLAAEFHYKFIRIHPFDDGNGRTARILMNFILMQYDFPPVIIKTQDKENYFAVLRMADAGNLEEFVNYIAENLNRSLEIMIAGTNGENIEEDDDLDKEIALLEQRLNSHKNDPIIYKNKSSVIELFENSIVKIKDLLEVKAQKFQSFYKKIESKYIIYKDSEDIEDVLINIERIVGVEFFYSPSSINELDNFNRVWDFEIKIEFVRFNKVGFDEFNFNNKIKFKLKSTSYVVKINGIKFKERPYGIMLSESEINEIVNSEIKRHTEFIEKKIIEKENKL